MRTMLMAVALLGCGSEDPPVEPSPDAPISVDATPDAPDNTGPTCRREPALDESCKFAFENLNGFACDDGAPLVGPGYMDCYTSGGLPGDPNFLMCCRDR